MRQKREHYLIDGYNIIHSWPELSSLVGELAEARDRLIHIMTEYGAYEQFDVTIVFDALFTTDEAHEEIIGDHISVIYTSFGETADSYIERLAYESVRREREVHVVTSDGAEQSVILGVGAYRLSSKELLRRVKKFKEKLRAEYIDGINSPISRSDVASRIDVETAMKLDRIRKA